MVIDLSSKKTLSPRLNALIDAALEVERDQQPKRAYLGGSRVLSANDSYSLSFQRAEG